MTGADYIKPSALGNFRAVWEELAPESEREDDYGLGHRDNLQVGSSVGVCWCGLLNHKGDGGREEGRPRLRAPRQIQALRRSEKGLLGAMSWLCGSWPLRAPPGLAGLLVGCASRSPARALLTRHQQSPAPLLPCLQDTVETVMSILGMHPCEGTEAVPPHARSHTVLLSGQFPGDERALVRCAAWGCGAVVELMTFLGGGCRVTFCMQHLAGEGRRMARLGMGV